MSLNTSVPFLKNSHPLFLKKGKLQFTLSQRQVAAWYSQCATLVTSLTVADELSEGAIFAQKKWQKFTSDIMTSIENKIEGSEKCPHHRSSKQFNISALRYTTTTLNETMIIWSDFQNSAEGNHFQRLGDYKETLKQNPTELSGIEVSIFQIISKKYSKYQTNEHTAWWRKLFAKAKADMNMWEKI